MFGIEETVDRREGKIGEFQFVVLHMLADPRGQAGGDSHRDAILGPAHRGEGDRDAGVEGVGELDEGPLVYPAYRAAGRLAVQALSGPDHLVMQAFGQKEPEFLGGRGHGGTRLLVGGEDHVLIDDHAKRPSGADLDGGLAVQVALGDPLANLLGFVGDAVGSGVDHQPA